ncbi:MAG: flagellin [Syntrophobacteraceae bacterium]
MRVTLGMSTGETLQNLNNQQVQIDTLSQEISSGVKLTAPSDDPETWSQAMNTNQNIREYNSFVSNINFGTGWGQATEAALNQLSSLVTQAKSVAESANSAAGSAESTTLASQVGGILNQALNLANTQYNGQYIFSGTATATQPYTIDTSTGAVTYSGNSDYIKVKTATGISSDITPPTSSAAGGGMTSVNLTGQEVLGGSASSGSGSNILNDIWNLQQALASGNTSQVSASITTLGNDFNQINTQLASVGTTLDSFTSQQTALSTVITNAQGVLSNYQDTDVAAATISMSKAQAAYQAALEVTSTLDNMNLPSILTG